ncbi:MAG TPA: WD40 repeat domain-containing serine/threonine protein kinase, partial [Thermoanaerobaculia bacterium]|nr:WD40 repeat domain-containing serine/threonine protein kinase [Thermoanaerobaculia bacterium]
MAISAGSRLGPYEVLSPLGAGGMGEVWLARDPRLGREVAIKVLPEDVSSDRDRVKRFELEARAASALNHPNIVTIHEVGEAQGRAYLVMERVEGQTLAEILHEGPLPIRRLLSIGAQAADGLARAHEGGIVHRDLKPQNLMVTKDGFVKILDFGLAKLVSSETSAAGLTEAPTATGAGTVLGTVGYMSPEQASGKPLDHRSDQFSLGAILYEMATGRRAFQRNTPVETLSAIIREDPEPVGHQNPRAPAPLRWTIERCLAKNPEDRYVSTRDLARDLASIRDHLSEASTSAEAITAPPRLRRLPRPALVLGVAALLAAIAAASFFLGERAGKSPIPSFQRLTFRRGHIWTARFAPDGKTVVYGGGWDGKPVQLFSTRLGSPESIPFALPGADLLAISSSGELALSLGRHHVGFWEASGTLARVALSGNAPREIAENVLAADWAPNGTDLAVVHIAGGRTRLEYPLGHSLHETAGWIGNPRVSRDGNLVAFVDHPLSGDDTGSITVADRAGKKKVLSGPWASVQGIGWSPDGKEIWFTASPASIVRSLRSVTLLGKARLIANSLGTLHDLSPDGRALIGRDVVRSRLLYLPPGEARERDLSWLDSSIAVDLSSDGTTVLFAEEGEGGGGVGVVYLRKSDGSPPVRLGEGYALALSPDKKWALAAPINFSELHLLPTGVGQARKLERGGIESYQDARFLPDSKRIVFGGRERCHRW